MEVLSVILKALSEAVALHMGEKISDYFIPFKRQKLINAWPL